MIESHSSTLWICPYCEADGSTDPRIWADHIDVAHPGKVPTHERHRRLFAEMGKRQILPALSCPLCNTIQPQERQSKIEDHILKHLHEFALRALPDDQNSKSDQSGKASQVHGSLSHTKELEGADDIIPKFSMIDATQFSTAIAKLRSLGLEPPNKLLGLIESLDSPLSPAKFEYTGSHFRKALDFLEIIQKHRQAPSESDLTTDMIGDLTTETWDRLTEVLNLRIDKPPMSLVRGKIFAHQAYPYTSQNLIT